MSKQPTKPKIGQGQFSAFLRQGFKELGRTTQAFHDSIQIDEPGQIGTATPMQVSQETGVTHSFQNNLRNTAKGVAIMNDGTIEFDVPMDNDLYEQFIDQAIEMVQQQPDMHQEMEQ